jgi:DNA repair protein SbcC/Rad50
MASRNVRVDSLFLDEGFGTLDDDALDTALGALSGLHQQGKLIGIISHVPTIKERISARISVEKKSNGRSILHAPGCRQIR